MWAAVHNGSRYPLAEDDFLLLDMEFRRVLDVDMLNESRHWLNEALIDGAIYSTYYLSKSYKLETDWLVFYEQDIAKQKSSLLKSNAYRHVWNELSNGLLLSKLINWREKQTETEVKSRELSISILDSLDKIRTERKIKPISLTKMENSFCLPE